MELKRSPDLDFRKYEYTLPNGRKVFLTNRPDVANREQVSEFLQRYLPIVRFQFTDDWVDYKPYYQYDEVVPFHWYPWIPLKDIPIEHIFAYLQLMDFYNKTAKPESSIWMHCDSSSMRAPTFFGLYLILNYPDKIKEICDGVITEDFQYVSRPDAYAEVELDRNENTKKLIEIWRDKGLPAAYRFIMGYEEW